MNAVPESVEVSDEGTEPGKLPTGGTGVVEVVSESA